MGKTAFAQEDRGPGYVPGPNTRRERIRLARDKAARERIRKGARLEMELERMADPNGGTVAAAIAPNLTLNDLGRRMDIPRKKR